jgi:cytosine/adenosine deaminase-related metal-dependent hydrolase
MNELLSLKNNFPWRGWEQLLSWATSGGAQALQMESIVGSLAVATRPGLLQIDGLEGGVGAVEVTRLV